MNRINKEVKEKRYAFIVDPLSSGALYTAEIIKFGLTPIAILSQFPILDIYTASFKEADFECVFTCRQDDKTLIEELEQFLGNEKPAFVLAGAECGVELADKLSDHFCPHLSNGTELSSARRNKFDMAEQLVKSHVPVPMTIQSHDVSEVLNWCQEHDLLSTGIVIKPLKSAGTDSVSACFNEKHVEEAMSNYLGKKNLFNSLNDTMLAQEFLAGTEYVVDTASWGGRHVVTNLCRYTKIKANGSAFVYDRLDFLPPQGKLQQELADYTFNVLDALGIQYGPAHSEVMYTQKGPRLVETGARVHGGIGVSACRLATGSSHLDLTLSLLLNEVKVFSNQIHYAIQKHTRIVFLISYFDSLVKDEHQNMSALKGLPSLQSLRLNIKPGDQLKKTVDLFSMPGLLILSHEKEEQVEHDYQAIRQLEQEGLFVL